MNGMCWWAGLAWCTAACAAAQAAPKQAAPKPAKPVAPAPANLDKRLADCEGLPDRARVVRYEPVGADALYAVTKSTERYLVFPTQEGVACAVFAMARPAAKTKGAFGGGTEALALLTRPCGGGSCATAIAVRGKDERPVAALRLEAGCNEGAELRPLPLFRGRDSLELVCRTSAGAGWNEARMLVDGTGDALAVLYQLDTGSYVALTQEEQRAGACPTRPIGAIRVEQTGDKPVLRVVDPAAGELQDGKGTLPARQLAWDAKQSEFTPTGAPDLPTKVDARAGCKR